MADRVPAPIDAPLPDLPAAWDARVARALARAPRRLQDGVAWLRHPGRRMARGIAGVLFILGGLLSILPVLGLWMLPLGLALLAEDSPALKAQLERATTYVERAWVRLTRRPGRRA